MTTPAQLALTATALETAAGASTSANATRSGYWKRIATAAESLAVVGTSANDNRAGYMLRAALALEAIAGTDGVAENTNYSGLLKRTVDALEALGAVGTGSLGERLVVGAEGATFPAFDPASLFGASEPGVFYDLSDAATLWEDDAGTTPATTVIGRIDDKSDNDKHATQTIAGSKPALGAGYATFVTDDGLATAAIDFTGTDAITIFAAVHKASDAAVGTIVELSAIFSGSNGTFRLTGPQGAGQSSYGVTSRGTSNAVAGASGFAAPISNVLAGLCDISADQSVLRVDGVQAATSASDQGTGAYGNHALYIGRRGGASVPFNGRIYALLIIGRACTALEIAAMETWLAAKIA